MKISNRIFDILQEKNISQQDFAEMTGISSSAISDWKRKGTNPSADKIITICRVLGVSPYYLLSGKENAGVMEAGYHSSAQERQLIDIFRRLSSGSKERLLGYAEALADTENIIPERIVNALKNQ